MLIPFAAPSLFAARVRTEKRVTSVNTTAVHEKSGLQTFWVHPSLPKREARKHTCVHMPQKWPPENTCDHNYCMFVFLGQSSLNPKTLQPALRIRNLNNLFFYYVLVISFYLK